VTQTTEQFARDTERTAAYMEALADLLRAWGVFVRRCRAIYQEGGE
jgi:hypothetical protein